MMLRRVLSHQRSSSIILASSARIRGPEQGVLGLPTQNHSVLSLATSDPSNLPFQVRWKRNDGNSSSFKPRKPTNKQKKKYNRRQREIYHEKVGKHSAPGAKAGIRREFAEEAKLDLMNHGQETEAIPELEYDYGDALLDDLMGNTAQLTSTPTPEPIYLGNKHKKYYNRVANQMSRHKEAMDILEANPETTAIMSTAGLPSDHDISMVVRSYRDRHGTRLRPVGVAKVLEHLLKDLNLPISTFGEETFTSILTVCSTPKEARRMFRLMQDVSHPISSYSWSILVDIHAKLGDFQGCDSVLREMVIAGVTPTLAAYTSLLAACYKVANAGHIPKSVRAAAGDLGWEKWKEMRIISVEPDAMAYGAMLRLCGARGQAEKAVNLLEEMPMFEVKPTTLCFTAALKAVARSHQIAVRFENGASTKFRKRQEVAAYHGRMAREVVILAEMAEVEHDEGFVAALILCAGASGDSATAKAILLASEIRKMDHLRTIGSEEHLDRLSGSVDPTLSKLFLNGDAAAADTMMQESFKEIGMTSGDNLPAVGFVPKKKTSYGEREYGKDSRVMSALMQACSTAVDSKGMGTLWEGRDNRGYLCEDSLRRLTIKPEPEMMDNSIPGVSSTAVGLGSLTYDEDEPEHLSKRLRRAKFQGITMDDSGTNMDDIDPFFYDMYKAEDPLLNRVNPDFVVEETPRDDPAWSLGSREATLPEVSAAEAKEEWYFDIDQRKWMNRIAEHSQEMLVNDFGLEGEDDEGDLSEGVSQLYYDATEGQIRDGSNERQTQSTEKESSSQDEWYFDQDESKWKTRDPNESPAMVQPALTEYESVSMSDDNQQSIVSYPNTTDDYQEAGGIMETSKPSFEEFAEMLKEDLGDDEDDFSEEEAREVYDMMHNNTDDSEDMAGQFDALEEAGISKHQDPNMLLNDVDKTLMLDDEQLKMMELMKAMGMDVAINDENDDDGFAQQEDTQEALAALNELTGMPSNKLQMDNNDLMTTQDDSLTAHAFEEEEEEEIDYMLEELQAALPGMPEQRVRKVRNAFKMDLGYPSLLTLAPLLRENMPERVTQEWLKRKNIQNAYFVVEKAKEDGLLDVHTMNGMLQVETSTGSIDRALACHEARFLQNGLEPTPYSDRLVLQMLVKNNRLPRALQFKERVERKGRNLDVHSYGTLIDYLAKHRKIGSAVMMLKECVDVHDSPPNEYSLNVLRRLCRHQHLTEKVGLVELAGPDPLEWLREGEANFKREKSYAGRRNILLPRNKSVDI